MPPPTVGSMPDLVSRSLAQQRFQTVMLALFALSALILTVVGIYGVIAATVGQRVHEIGIRMALGARGGTVARQFAGRGLRLVAIGVLIGLLASFWLTRFLTGMLFGVAPIDPSSLAAGVVVLVGAGLAAAWIPARRAVRVTPVDVLRTE